MIIIDEKYSGESDDRAGDVSKAAWTSRPTEENRPMDRVDVAVVEVGRPGLRSATS